MRHTILLLLASAAVAHGQPTPVEDTLGLFFDPRSANASSLLEPRADTARGHKDDASGGKSLDTPAAQRRIVGIAKDQLARARGQASAGSATRLRLNLLAGVDMIAVIDRTAPTSRGYSLAGHIAGMEEVSNVVLVVNGTVVVGDVWTPQGHYTIRTAGGGSYLIEKTDPAQRKPLGEPILPTRVEDGTRGAERRSKNGPQATGEGGEDDGSTIDIFVFWTQNARLDAGGLRNMQAFVDLAIAGANEAYLASDIQTRLNLVGATEVHYDYEAAGNDTSTLLSHLAAPDDGYMSEVHDVRDAYSSDLVHLFFGRSDTDFGFGGLAHIWGPFGLSDMRVRVFIHEVGHNMGLFHEAYQLVVNERGEELRRDIEQGLYDDHIRLYGIGYVNQRAFDAGADEERRWGTVMAYGTQCGVAGFYCDELSRFSNPRQRWPSGNGDPMGIAEEDAGADDWPADAIRAVNENKRALANWYQESARCQFDLLGEALEMPADGGSATIEVDTSGGASCPWHAVTNDTFVDVAVERDTVVIRATANGGRAREGVVSIAGSPVLLRQLGRVAPVSICDRAPAVQQAIVEATGRTACRDVTALDLAAIRTLDLSNRGLASLTKDDLDFLDLTNLDLSGNDLGDISALSDLVNLRTVSLNDNRIENISPLSYLADLRGVYLWGNAIVDISPLSGLSKLGQVHLDYNQIVDISPLSDLPRLQHVLLGGNQIEDISPLSDVPNLFTVFLGGNRIEDISPVADWAPLNMLNLAANAIVDISALRRNANLGRGDQLELSGNPLNEESAGPHISALRARGVDVVFQPRLRVQGAVAIEGEALMFHVRLAPAVDNDVRLAWWAGSPSSYPYPVPPPFAEEGADYSSDRGEAVVIAGTTETMISVPTFRDAQPELDERLAVNYMLDDGGDEAVQIFHWQRAIGVIKDASNRDVATGDFLSLNVSRIFAFLGDAIEYRVTVGDPALVQAYVEGGVLRIVPLGNQLGETTVTVLARTPGRSRELVVNVELTDAPTRSWVRGWRLAIPSESGPTSTAESERTASP